jgi:hypothetical protein
MNNPFNKIARHYRQQQCRKAFALALLKYFSDVAFNHGEKSQAIVSDLNFRSQWLAHHEKRAEQQGIEAALSIIFNYRHWEGKTWQQAGKPQ